MKEFVETSSVLAIKIDKRASKVFFFDVVDEKYHLIASSEVKTTCAPPYNDVREGISKAIDRISHITGRRFFDEESNFILPVQADGSGVDNLVITFGFFSEIKVVSMGLLESVSLESLKKLLSMTQLDHIDQVGMNDQRKLDEIISLFKNKTPEMVIISGGIDDGAATSIFKQLDMLLFCIKLLPKEKRPYIIFSGNEGLETKIRETINEITLFDMTPHLRYTMDKENLYPAFIKVNKINGELMRQKIGGFGALSNYSQSTPMPFSQSMILMAKFLSLIIDDQKKKLLIIDFGKECISFTTGNGGEGTFSYLNYSLNNNLEQLVKEIKIQEIIQSAYEPLDEEEIKLYLWEKTLTPDFVPTTQNHLAIEKALISAIIKNHFVINEFGTNARANVFDQIIFSGEIFANYLQTPEALLSVLDGVLPVGISTFYLDSNGILPVLGSIANSNRVLPVQILESSTISLLAKVITIISTAKIGTMVASIQIEYGDGLINEISIEQGMIYRLPVPTGQIVKIKIEQKNRLEIDSTLHSRPLSIQSGICGIIIDARGRPIMLPKEEVKRKDLVKKWLYNLLN